MEDNFYAERKFAFGYLRRALADLYDLTQPGGKVNRIKMGRVRRAMLFAEVKDWLLNEDYDGLGSLDWTCDALGWNAQTVRTHVRRYLRRTNGAGRTENAKESLVWLTLVRGQRILPPAIVRDIRSSEEPTPVIARRYGIHGDTVRKIRNGRRHTKIAA